MYLKHDLTHLFCFCEILRPFHFQGVHCVLRPDVRPRGWIERLSFQAVLVAGKWPGQLDLLSFPNGQLYRVSWALVEAAWAWDSGPCVRSSLLRRQVSWSRDSKVWLGPWLYHLTSRNNKACIYFLFVSRSTHVITCVWKSGDNMQESILSWWGEEGTKLRSLGLAASTFTH